MPEIPSAPEGRPMWERIRDILGLDFKAPKGAKENLRYSYGIIPAIRNGLSRVFSLGNAKR